MADDTGDIKPEAVDMVLGEMKLEEEWNTTAANDTYKQAPSSSGEKRSLSTTPGPVESTAQSPAKKHSASQTPKSEYDEEVVGGDITVIVEPGEEPKLSRKSSQKVITRAAPLFDDLPDATKEAVGVFQLIKDCIYGSKYMGYSEHDALDCDCSEEWRKSLQHPQIAIH